MQPHGEGTHLLLRLQTLEDETHRQVHELPAREVLPLFGRQHYAREIFSSAVKPLEAAVAEVQREVAEDQSEQQHAHRKHILLAAEAVLARGGFRGSVGVGLARGVPEGLLLLAAFQVLELLGELRVVGLAEVDQLGHVVAANQDVVGRDVEVGDFVPLDEADGVGEVGEQGHLRVGGESEALAG